MASDVERRGLLPNGLKTEQVELTAGSVVVVARSGSIAAACPQCGRPSRQVHSRYRRRLADLPAHGREVRILLTVRRFRCRTKHCRAEIFAERFPPEVTLPLAPDGANYLIQRCFFSRNVAVGEAGCNPLVPDMPPEAGRNGMAKTVLTEARVKALRPRKSVREVRDGRLRGFGVRVSPSGRKQFFIQCQLRGERIWKIVGEAGSMSVDEARAAAGDMLAAIRRGEEALHAPGETLFEAVAEVAFRRHERLWKPGTLCVNRSYLRRQLLPHFAGRPIAEIDRREVWRWFARLRATPVAADRSMPILSVIMREAETMGLRPEGSNPCRGIRRYRRKGRARFLSDQEIRRLSARLSTHAKACPLQVAIIRLLLLTGCRKSEILTIRWTDYRDGTLFLRDSKTGPRTVWLSAPARAVLDGLERKGGWVFPASRGDRPRSATWLDRFWYRVRAEAELEDVRLHDLRHTIASLALRQGETVLAIGRLLGHRNPGTTLTYIHLADAMVMDAVETVGAALEKD